MLAEVAYGANAFGFWAKQRAASTSATSGSARPNPFVLGTQAASCATGRSASSASSARGTTR